jgi:hypothetical protein
MTASQTLLDELEHAARGCEDEEAEFRRTMNARVAALAEARAFAHRRMNIMRSLFDTVAQADDGAIAVAAAVAALRNRLGWREESEARDEVLERYGALALAAFHATREDEASVAPDTPAPDVGAALAEFEAWYAEARGKPFWVLFEHYMPETQLVDF